MKKVTLEEHFISPEYAQHVRDLQSKGAGAGFPAEFKELLADPVMRKGIGQIIFSFRQTILMHQWSVQRSLWKLLRSTRLTGKRSST